jgi:Spy/CpxP family protein refolding chaperone
MTAKLKWLLALALVVVFAAGIATGVFADAWRAKHQKVVTIKDHDGGAPPRLTERMTRRFERELNLTPQQVEQMRPVFEETARKLSQIRQETGERVQATLTESHEQMAQFLTPEQREQLKQMKPRLRHRMKFRHMHGPRRDRERPLREHEEEPANGS